MNTVYLVLLQNPSTEIVVAGIFVRRVRWTAYGTACCKHAEGQEQGDEDEGRCG
jgi:hypothetical protein